MLIKQQNLCDDVICLKTLDVTHAPALHVMMSDEYICDKAGLTVNTHISQTLQFIIENNMEVNKQTQYLYGIFVEDVLVGMINFFNIDYMAKSGEYGYFMASDHSRQGYMKRSIILLTNFILENTNIIKVNSYIDLTNKASLALIQALEFTEKEISVEEDLQGRNVRMVRYERSDVIKTG